MKKRYLLILTVLTVFVGLCTPHRLKAQSFAVQSTTQLIPPYSVYLSDYAAPGNEKLQVILIQRDLTQPAYQIRLVMVVEWNGKVIMRTSRAFTPRPISLDPGIPSIISGADLAPYLDIRNIDFVGYSRDLYARTKALPEGSYRICFIAYDYRRQDVQVSNDGCNFYYLSKSEPPLANFPACGSKEPFRTPQQVIFSWLPRNTSSPASAAETEYEFSLYETRPAGRNPNDVVLTTQPVFKTVTDLTQLIYGPAEPVLLEGMTYVWRVRAIDKNGKDAFRNNGYSEVCTFRYGGFDPQFDIGVVKGLQAEGQTERKGRIWWETGEYEGYRVEYKKSGKDHNKDDYEWFSNDTKSGEVKIYDLEPDTEYETRVHARKNSVYGPPSEIIKFRTSPVRIARCGENTELPKITDVKPLAFATTGMVVQARGMEMTLVEVTHTGQDGYYKGVGKVAPRYLGGASFHVKFERIFIDESRTVVGPGRIDFITQGVANMVQQQLAQQDQRQKEALQEENRETWAGTEFHEKMFVYDQPIDTVVVDPNGNLVVTYASGITETNTEINPILEGSAKAVIIEDKNGDQWVVQKDKTKTPPEVKVTKVQGGGLSPSGAASVSNVSIDIIKQAIRALRREYDDGKIRSMKDEMEAALSTLDQQIASSRNAIIPSGQDPDADGESIFSNFDEMGETSGGNSAFDQNSIRFKTAELNYNRGVVVQWLANDLNNKEAYRMIAQGLSINGQNADAYIQQQKQQNVQDDAIVNNIKTAVIDYITKVLTEQLYKKL